VVGYIALLHAVVLVLVLKTDFLLLAGKTLGFLPPEEWSADIAWAAVDLAARDAAAAPGAVVLVGDSIIAQLAPEFAGDTGFADLGLGGDTTRTLLRRLPGLRSIGTAARLVIGVGVNDLKYREVPEIAKDYAALLAHVPAALRVTVVSVLPVDERSGILARRPYLRNATITRLNQALRLVCEARPACRFLDAWPGMTGPGLHGPELHGDDGWHLSRAGSAELARLIRAEVAGR
jgi:lysophospholipase L1-like esterase